YEFNFWLQQFIRIDLKESGSQHPPVKLFHKYRMLSIMITQYNQYLFLTWPCFVYINWANHCLFTFITIKSHEDLGTIGNIFFPGWVIFWILIELFAYYVPGKVAENSVNFTSSTLLRLKVGVMSLESHSLKSLRPFGVQDLNTIISPVDDNTDHFDRQYMSVLLSHSAYLSHADNYECLKFSATMPPLQILDIGRERFEINVQNFNTVLDKVPDKPVVLLSINGCMREGKSYVLSYFIRYLKHQGNDDWFTAILEDHESFNWKSGSTRDTIGINIWSEPFITKVDGREVAVILLDSQEENVLKNIQEYSKYAAAIASKSPKHQDTKPYFMFLIRDFEFVEEFDYGFHNKHIRPKRELNNPKNYYHGVFTDTNEMHEENREVRGVITECYKDIGMFLMPRPGTKFIKNGKKFSPDKEFQELLKEMTEHVMSNLVIKRIGTKEVTGTTLKAHIQSWADLCKSKEFPKAETIQEKQMECENNAAYEKALDHFGKKCDEMVMSSASGNIQENFSKKLRPLVHEAVELYKTSRTLGDDNDVRNYVLKLALNCAKNFNGRFGENVHSQ
ncbi:unnamed protein product, partial [Allacma fusca]